MVVDYSESTDHAAVYMDVDLDNFMGKSELWADIKRAEIARREDSLLNSFGTVRPTDTERVQEFHDELLAENDTEAMLEEAKAL
jgi:hypothetical protein